MNRSGSLPSASASAGIIKPPMMALSRAGENWATFLCMVADGNQMMKVLVEVFIKRIRGMG